MAAVVSAEYFRVMFAYNRWAHERVWECLMPLSDEQFVRDLGYSFGSVRNQVVHVMNGDRRWLARLRGQTPPDFLPFEDYPTSAAARERWNSIEAEFFAYIQSLTDDDLSRELDLDFPNRGGVKHNAVWQILAQLVNHGTDHRAQILALLHQLSASTVEQDFIHYLWR